MRKQAPASAFPGSLASLFNLPCLPHPHTRTHANSTPVKHIALRVCCEPATHGLGWKRCVCDGMDGWMDGGVRCSAGNNARHADRMRVRRRIVDEIARDQSGSFLPCTHPSIHPSVGFHSSFLSHPSFGCEENSVSSKSCASRFLSLSYVRQDRIG